MNPFEAYAGKAKTIVERPAPLIGITKTRREARVAYDELVGRIKACRTRLALEECLADSEPQILQFHAEMPFLWEGDGEEFAGLEREIEAAFETVEAAQYFAELTSFGRPPEASRCRCGPGYQEEETGR